MQEDSSLCARVCVCARKVCCQIHSLHSDSDRQTLCSCVTHREGERGAGRERTSLLVIQLMDYVLFKWHLVSSAKTTLKPHFCHVTYFIKVLPKINAVTMNTLRGRADIELDAHQRTGSRLILPSRRSEVNFLLLKSKENVDRWKIWLSRPILF